MAEATLVDREVLTAPALARRRQQLWRVWFAAILGLTGALGWLMLRSGPDLLYPLILLALGVGLLVLQQPRYGLYLCVFLTLVGDGVMLPWYPFSKNLSSPESLLYLGDQLIVSPLEICLVGTMVIWLSREGLQRRLKFHKLVLFWPVMVFALFCVGGLLFGLARGGDLRIALWEVRPLMYLPVLVVLVGHLLTRREHLKQLLWLIALALFAEALIVSYRFLFVLRMQVSDFNSITEHSAPVHMTLVIVWLAAAWMFGGSRRTRLGLPVLVLPMLVTMLAAQRRAAIVALLVGLVLMALVLFQYRRRLFWFLVPAAALAGVVYVAAFWNATGMLGMPVRAIKSVIAPSQISLRDQSSNAYRVIENVNTLVTIREAPLTGVGFGRKFVMAVALPDISFFEWWEYITHNSVLWVWMKTGLFGFLALLALIGTSIVAGLRALWRMPTGDLRAAVCAAVLYLVMHYIYAYVDMSWDMQSMVLVGTMLGLLSAVERIVAQPVPTPPKRWPWQAEAAPAPGLL